MRQTTITGIQPTYQQQVHSLDRVLRDEKLVRGLDAGAFRRVIAATLLDLEETECPLQRLPALHTDGQTSGTTWAKNILTVPFM